ncbi:MAG TPA: helix-turn-helix transcriptional regulator [Paludibacter sp.]
MLKVNILRVCEIRGIKKPLSFFKNHGFSPATATRMAGGYMNSFSLETVEKLCLALNCTPNDLLEWTPSKNIAPDATHPLNDLKRDKALLANFTELVNSASLQKLEKIQEIIQRELGEVNS